MWCHDGGRTRTLAGEQLWIAGTRRTSLVEAVPPQMRKKLRTLLEGAIELFVFAALFYGSISIAEKANKI
jgi:hypothetical protein